MTPPQDALWEEIKRATENGRLAQQHWDRAERAEAEVRRLREALCEARPYVFNRIVSPDHPEHDWRSETAEGVLARVDAALADDAEEEK